MNLASSYLRYSIARLGLFVVGLLVAWAVGHLDVYGVIGAALLSALVSWFLLRGPREAMARDLDERVSGRLERRDGASARSRWDIDAEAEDAEADRLGGSTRA